MALKDKFATLADAIKVSTALIFAISVASTAIILWISCYTETIWYLSFDDYITISIITAIIATFFCVGFYIISVRCQDKPAYLQWILKILFPVVILITFLASLKIYAASKNYSVTLKDTGQCIPAHFALPTSRGEILFLPEDHTIFVPWDEVRMQEHAKDVCQKEPSNNATQANAGKKATGKTAH